MFLDMKQFNKRMKLLILNLDPVLPYLTLSPELDEKLEAFTCSSSGSTFGEPCSVMEIQLTLTLLKGKPTQRNV